MGKLVIKRDGRHAAYDKSRITTALRKAILASGDKEYAQIAEKLSSDMETELAGRYPERVYHVEDIQDLAERALMSHGLYDAARAFIRYRAVHENVRNIRSAEEFCEQTIIGYTGEPDVTEFLDPGAEDIDSSAEKNWHVKQNASVSYSVGAMILNNSERISKAHWLGKFYDKEIVDAYKSGAIHIHDLGMLTGYCFTGDTRIKTLDGKNPTLKELAENPDDKFWVLAYDRQNNQIVPAQATAARKTRTVTKLAKIALTDGSVITSTTDHPFMTRDGNYVEAENLKPNMSLMPLYIGEKSRYRSINKVWHGGQHKGYLHRWVAEWTLGRNLKPYEAVHHINGDKHDCRPENLRVMNDSDHRAVELAKTIQSDLWKENNAKRLREYNACAEKRNQISDLAKARFRSKDGRFVPFAYVASADPGKEAYNHCVRKVELVEVEPTDVYDITVPVYHNFALDCGVFVHNCAGWDLKKLIREGLGGVKGKISSGPAKHLSTLSNQMVNFLGIMQNEWAGAQAFSSFDTYLAPFVKADHLNYREVKQCMQSFVYGVNIPSRWGTQAPFSNITLDWTCPDDLKNLPAVVGGKEQDFTYGDCEEEMRMVNKAFIETMVEGDCNGRGFAYPIPTYSITRDFDWGDTENNRLLFEMAAKYGTPYFSNYINSDMEPSDVRSMCCRLRLDLRELRKQNGGNFGAGENTGSIGVVTINMPRIAYLASDEEDFFRRLEHMMDISARSLDIKRRVINKYMDMGLYPYTRRYLPQGFVNHFSTLGLVGMNEACLNADWIGEDLSNPKAAAWTAKVLDFMREKLKDYQEEYGNLFNLEATPAESTAYRLAKHDRALYPDIITAGKKGETPYYTNSSHLPVGFTSDVFEALDIQDNLQTKYTSGTVFHCFLGEKLPDWKAAMQLVRAVAENYRLPYFTLSPVYSVCEEHGYLSGEQKVCPVCGKPTEVYSRITGYYRPVSNWNDGKLQEFEDRKSYEVTGRYAAGLSDTNEGGAGHAGPNGHEAQAAGHAALESVRPAGAAGEELLLFTTPSCPNCASLKQRHVISGYREVNAADPANRELVRKYRIMAAPTLIVRKPDGGTEKYANASEIMGFAAKESTTRG